MKDLVGKAEKNTRQNAISQPLSARTPLQRALLNILAVFLDQSRARVQGLDDGLDLLEPGVLGVADQGKDRALRRVEEGPDPAHALQGEMPVGLRPAGNRVDHNMNLKPMQKPI